VMRYRRRPVVTVFIVIALAGLALLPRLSFDSDPLHTKNAHTEAMRTLYELMESPVTNPFTIDILTPNATGAGELAKRIAKLPTVAQTLSVDSFVPDDQEAKLALIADANNILAPTIAARPAPAPVTPEQLRLAARTALDQIRHALPKLPPKHPLADIADDLAQLTTAPDAVLLATNQALTRFLPAELEHLRLALEAEPVTFASLPPEITRDWLLPDGQARVQVVPKRAASNSAGLFKFVNEVKAVAPDAGGSAVTIVATSETIIGAFRTAAISALVAIAVILLVALRRLLDVALVLAPLLLSALMTVILAVLLPLPLNYANIIALPLLLGVGVSFNIYFVMNWRAGRIVILGSPTARAILFSALTTATAFGSLALSADPGTASMGKLLLISLACTLVASLVFIPALLASVKRANPS
jgi:hopanoid biosynthesis associated RND transporter like protein HpnN